MNRRHFLWNLALTAGGVYVSTKTIFLPPVGGWPTVPHVQQLLNEAHLDAVMKSLWNPGIRSEWIEDELAAAS